MWLNQDRIQENIQRSYKCSNIFYFCSMISFVIITGQKKNIRYKVLFLFLIKRSVYFWYVIAENVQNLTNWEFFECNSRCVPWFKPKEYMLNWIEIVCYFEMFLFFKSFKNVTVVLCLDATKSIIILGILIDCWYQASLHMGWDMLASCHKPND